MQVKLCGVENCIQLLDKGSGLTTVGKGDTVQHALGDAVGAMLTTLLEKRLLSMHDLCREHIHFPHPDQQTCPGVEINTCDLSKPVLPQRKKTDRAESIVDLFSLAHFQLPAWIPMVTPIVRRWRVIARKACSKHSWCPIVTRRARKWKTIRSVPIWHSSSSQKQLRQTNPGSMRLLKKIVLEQDKNGSRLLHLLSEGIKSSMTHKLIFVARRERDSNTAVRLF